MLWGSFMWFLVSTWEIVWPLHCMDIIDTAAPVSNSMIVFSPLSYTKSSLLPLCLMITVHQNHLNQVLKAFIQLVYDINVPWCRSLMTRSWSNFFVMALFTLSITESASSCYVVCIATARFISCNWLPVLLCSVYSGWETLCFFNFELNLYFPSVKFSSDCRLFWAVLLHNPQMSLLSRSSCRKALNSQWVGNHRCSALYYSMDSFPPWIYWWK